LLTVVPVLVDAPFNVITGQIIGAAIEVHRILGPGLLESAYMPCLQFELAAGKLRFVADRPFRLCTKGWSSTRTIDSICSWRIWWSSK